MYFFFFFLYFFLAGDPNEQSFQLYKTQIYYSDQQQRSGNVEPQNNYSQKEGRGPEMMNNYQGKGFRREEAMFNPTGSSGRVLMHIF